MIKIYGQNIRKHRQEKGINLEEFAGIIGISHGTLSDIELGKTFPSGKTLHNIIQNTDMTIYDIFPENDADIQKRSIIRKTWEDLDLQEVGGGKPVVIVKDVPVFSIPLPKRCIREGSFMGKNVGDANHSQIRDGALLLIDPNDREIRSGYFYCLNLPGEGAVARQIFNLVNKFRLSCVNEKFPSVELEHEELQEYMVGNIYICVNIYDGRLGV